MRKINLEQNFIKKILSDEKLAKHIKDNLSQSMKSIGFSKKLINDLIIGLESSKIDSFLKKHTKELTRVHTIGFFQKIVPDYFGKYIIPEVTKCENFLDLGCGTGILMKKLAETKKSKNLTGIDILKYPEWENFKQPNIDFKLIKEKNILSFIKNHKPDSVAITWTLHHIDKNQQKKYLKSIYNSLENNSKVIILEDSYSETMKPKEGSQICNNFMKLSKEDRGNVMSAFDWIANRIMAQRKKVNIPFSFRSLEEWIEMCEEIGFKCIAKKFIGFPDKRDINTPQSLFILKK